jgi:hypothetical protein
MMPSDPMKAALMKKRQGLNIIINLGGDKEGMMHEQNEMMGESMEKEDEDMESEQENKKSDLAPPTKESKEATKEQLMQEAAKQPETAKDMGWYGRVSKAFGMKER